jgi:hypothetical protein
VDASTIVKAAFFVVVTAAYGVLGIMLLWRALYPVIAAILRIAWTAGEFAILRVRDAFARLPSDVGARSVEQPQSAIGRTDPIDKVVWRLITDASRVKEASSSRDSRPIKH